MDYCSENEDDERASSSSSTSMEEHHFLSKLHQSSAATSSSPTLLTQDLFLSLCFKATSASLRLRLLTNAEKFAVRPHVLLAVMLGFTRDPYPYVRAVALDGLVAMTRSPAAEVEPELVEACYHRSLEVMVAGDVEECVRAAAVRGVIQWGKLFVALNHENTKKDFSDALFVQICSMVRDMSMKVRVEAFNALGELSLVSDDLLLQTLSKKILPAMDMKTYPVLFSAKPFESQASSAAGAFLHGLEDEFFEVRRSACHSLHTFSILSSDFAGEALNLLIEVLNDDSMVVRLQALETMRCMALFNYLKLQETHLHMFLSVLVDPNASVRTAARKVLRVAKLNRVDIFRICVDGLLENLELHSQDEADVLSVLFDIGRSHGTFAVKVIKGVLDEIEPSSNGMLGFDSGRIAALLVLSISAPLSHELHQFDIPPRIFSYAVTMLGRISHALSDIMDEDSLLVYLSHCSRSNGVSAADFQFNKKGPSLRDEGGMSNNSRGEKDSKFVSYQLEDYDDKLRTMESIFEKGKDIWQLIRHGCIGEVLKTLSGWKEELATSSTGSSSDAVAFTSLYLKVVKVLATMWPHFLSQRKLRSCSRGDLSLLLEKLDRILRKMQYRFSGLSELEELYVLELTLLNFIIRLSTVEAYCDSTSLKKLRNFLPRAEFLIKQQNIDTSSFVAKLKESIHEIDYLHDQPFCNPILFQKLIEFFSLKQFVLCGKFKHIKAELDIHNNDFENPFRFISGLPVGIPLELTLYNVTRENRLWIRLVVDEALAEFVFIDLDQFKGYDKPRKLTFVAPFYKTPRASSFTIKVYVCIECLSGDIHPLKGRGGPKREFVYLCKKKEVFLSTGMKLE